MKALGVTALLVAALAAGFAGSLIQSRAAEPEPVEAQANNDRGVRIALVNLEECARNSAKFADLKDEWEESQKYATKTVEEIENSAREKADELRNARRQDSSQDSILALEVELKTLQEKLEVAKEQHKDYLGTLLNQYQRDVLEEVVNAVERHVKLKGYDIVLQDYTVESSDAAFFEGSAYAQAVLSTPVVYAPGIEDNSNAYVTDITKAVERELR